MTPKCSVIIPCKNRHETVKNAVCSALAISVANEVIIVDDLSSPKITMDLFSGYSDKSKINIISNFKTAGAQGARVSGALSAKNDILIFLDSDDLLLSQGVIDLYETLLSDQELALCYGNVRFGESSSNFLQLTGDSYRSVLKNMSLCPFSGIIVRRYLVSWHKLDLSLPAWQDDDFILTISSNQKITFVDTYSSLMIPSDDSISKSKKKQLIGLTKLLKKWKSEIIKEFGWNMFVLWRIRQLVLYLFSLSQYFYAKSSENNTYRFVYKIAARITRRVGTILITLVRRHFDRIY